MFVLQMKYIQRLINGCVQLVIGSIIGVAVCKLARAALREGELNDRAFTCVMAGAIAGVVGGATLITSLTNLLSIYNWVGSFNPYAAVAIKVMEHVFNK